MFGGGGAQDIGRGEGSNEGIASFGPGEQSGEEWCGGLGIGDVTETPELAGDNGVGVEDEEGLKGARAQGRGRVKGKGANAIGKGSDFP